MYALTLRCCTHACVTPTYVHMYYILVHKIPFVLHYRCVPFPHSHLLCGQYIDASAVVYINPNVFNYTEANSRIIQLDNGLAFGLGTLNSCQWIVIYTVCLSIYPHCNISTQKLVPPCTDDCLEYTNRCRRTIRGLTIITAIISDNDSLEMLFVLNCSDPFRAFDSVNVDAENCYNFTCKLVCMYVRNIVWDIKTHDSESRGQEEAQQHDH